MSLARGRTRRHAGAVAVGVDTGGTFTDFVALSSGRLIAFKIPSTPHAPARAVLEGLERSGAARDTRVRHGSTIATNALLERRGARVTLVTTRGFEDLIEIGRQDRPDLYALAPRRVEPLVTASRRVGVDERLDSAGETLRVLSPRALADAVRAARATRPHAIAIGLLHAWAHARHERRLERALAALGVPVTRSSALCPEVREYERLATTVTNAYLAPRVAAYLREIARGTRARLEIVLSHGGTAPAARAAREPVRQLLSGPAAGLRAARDVARACGFTRALTLDVGGTSTDVAYVEGELPRRRAREVAGFPVLLPILDVHTVGAGGGSIASVDDGGLLEVGPASAGAVPGPACYGRGGPATLTDALVTLGRLPIAALAEGALKLDPAAARRALASLAKRLPGRDAIAAAEGVVQVAEARMEAALRRVSIERGHDPRGAALVAFGGAGGLHACALAEALGCEAAVFPTHAGVLSALGALIGGSRRERSRSVMRDARDRAALERGFLDLERRVLGEFPAGERGSVSLERIVLARYRGQAHEIEVGHGRDWVAGFHRAHERRFGFSIPAAPVEAVTLEVRGGTPGEFVPRARPTRRKGAPEWARVRESGAWRRSRVVGRDTLAAGARLRGPAVVTDAGATLWIASGWTARVHASGGLVLRRSVS
ncbi:MAG: hydantoinase/oxoprolinase family protein [Candidatus Eisenbacteria bacterium]|nr:hydantoinase/oxoprolinase family protein [Candidatus Eisenbacteria bacterium]